MLIEEERAHLSLESRHVEKRQKAHKKWQQRNPELTNCCKCDGFCPLESLQGSKTSTHTHTHTKPIHELMHYAPSWSVCFFVLILIILLHTTSFSPSSINKAYSHGRLQFGDLSYMSELLASYIYISWLMSQFFPKKNSPKNEDFICEE